MSNKLLSIFSMFRHSTTLLLFLGPVNARTLSWTVKKLYIPSLARIIFGDKNQYKTEREKIKKKKEKKEEKNSHFIVRRFR